MDEERFNQLYNRILDGENWDYSTLDELISLSKSNAREEGRQEMKKKAIDAYIENCEYKSEWCCGCAEAHGAILSEPDVCMGINCPAVKQFIEKINL